MEKYTDSNSKSVSIRMPNEMYAKIEEMAKVAERKPSEQIRYIIKQYIEIKEKD